MSNTATASLRSNQMDLFTSRIEVIKPRLVKFDKKIITPAEKKVYGMVNSFAEVNEHATLIALIINQASEDSMIHPYFSKRSTEAIFESPIPDSYDGFLFMSTDRLDIYATMINLDPDDIRNKWKFHYKKWVSEHSKLVAENIFDHIKKIERTPNLHTTAYKDAASFLKSTQCEYWESFL